ncbi:MAG: hypothetical protein IJT43_03065 [Stomatobaculum sp.]|nr:hypothetical protein [Stomatobaculum sp.]
MKWNLMKAAAAVTAAAAVVAMTACGNQFKASPDMAGSATIAENVENLEKLNEKKTEAFLKAVNKKYDVDVTDYTVNFQGEGAIDLELEELLGDDNDKAITLKFGGEVSGDQAGNTKFTDFDGEFGIPVLGDIKMKADSYTDMAAKESYTMLKEIKAENGLFDLLGAGALSEDVDKWTRSEIKAPEEAKKAVKLTLDPAAVNGVYMDKNTGSYIVDVNLEALNSLQENVKIKDAGERKMYLTYDKGLALCGLHASGENVTMEVVIPEDKAAEANISEDTELKLQNFVLHIDLKALNSGVDVSVPEDVKANAEENTSDESMDMLSGISDLLS